MTVLSLAVTRPASMAARARARLSNRPRSTSKISARLQGGDMLIHLSLTRGESRGFQANARLECGQIMPDVLRRPLWRHQCAAMPMERVYHHQVVAQAA